jgi:hypothetical protein
MKALDHRGRVYIPDWHLTVSGQEQPFFALQEKRKLPLARVQAYQFWKQSKLELDWEIEPRLRPPPLANPEGLSRVPFPVVRIARTRGLALLFQ